MTSMSTCLSGGDDARMPLEATMCLGPTGEQCLKCIPGNQLPDK